jgi:hypothetical protein
VATISSLLADHVSLRVRSVDRIFLAGHVPRLQPDRMLVGFLNQRVGGTIPSPAMLGKILRAYVKEINTFAKAREIRRSQWCGSPTTWSRRTSRARTCRKLRGPGAQGW